MTRIGCKLTLVLAALGLLGCAQSTPSAPPEPVIAGTDCSLTGDGIGGTGCPPMVGFAPFSPGMPVR